mmetsp:Transcript_43754/g.104031  ORF Transcript_43754/g.104031 Transcript_43754/m.104031 type:complete len:335 (+) Transcript_43754:1098-2102(+)
MPNLANCSGYITGYCTVSCSSFLVASSPPMSSQVTLGTSTTVSRSAEGLVAPSAKRKWSLLTDIESRTSASMVSSSRSITSIFSRMHWSAASVQRAARSAPTKPCVSRATCSRSTSSDSFMFLVWMRSTSMRPVSSGTPMSTSRSKRPKRRSAGSMELGRLVAAMTMMCARDLSPSMRVRSCETMRRSTSPLTLSRLGAIESISSMKMIDGAFFSASVNALRRLSSDSPAIFDMISGPLMRKKKAPVSLATARAISVLPEPGGPNMSMPLGGLMPRDLKSCGWRSGSSTSSRICASCLRTPPMSSYPMSSSRSSSSRLMGSPSQKMTVSGATMQ